MGYLGQGNETVPIYLSLYSRRLPIHLQEDKDNCLIFLAFSLLDNKSLSIILMIELFLCNKYLSFFIMVLVNFLCSCWLCLFFFVGASASDSPSSFLFSFFNLVFFFFLPVVFPSFWVVCDSMSSCSCFFYPSSCFFSFSCVSFSSSPMLFCYFFLSFLLLCMYLV